ncbi:hypothetical protein [Metabacillus litoralis]|uniref:hypothetical protein n=1 Tax=Metabacillus litoralis TaxID=152268 RepID=UPI00203ECA2A|nr:hypothetical protein [Metabacillus litoralis]
MERYLGIITDECDLESYKESLRNFAARVNKKIDVILLTEVNIIEEFLKENHEKYCRVIFYDYEEFNNIKQLQNVFGLCQHYNLELSIIKQDIHSDVAVELSYLLQVI